MKTLFKNAKILDYQSETYKTEGNVVVTDNIITYVGSDIPNEKYDKIYDVNGNILMPGFVNCHAHTPMTLLRGFKDDVNLQDWLFNYIFPAEAKLTPNDIYWGQMLGIAEYVRAGITCAEENYFFTDEMLNADVKAGFRERISFGPKVNDTKIPTKYLEESYKSLSQKCTDLITLSIFIHSIYTINEQSILDTLTFARKHNIPVGIHLSETLTEVGDCTTKNKNQTPPQYLETLGFFDRPNALCAHCVHMDKDDLQILADYDASIATNPSSNIKLASGIPPIYAILNKGINVCIGTDGVASNNSLDMFKEMFLTACLPKANLYMPDVVTAKQVLKMATINGAKALGINAGEIKVGKLADIIVVDINSPHMHPFGDIASMLVYSAKSSDVCLTMVNGKVLYENGKYNIGESIADIYANCDKIRSRLQ